MRSGLVGTNISPRRRGFSSAQIFPLVAEGSEIVAEIVSLLLLCRRNACAATFTKELCPLFIREERDFNDWLEGLAGKIRKDMEKIGFEKCKTMFPFTRHVMERNDIGMDEWMKQNLDSESLAHWEKQNEMYEK